MNLGIFGGRLGRDAELNSLPNGDPVLNFSVAVDVGTRDNPKTLWVECALYGKRAATMRPYLTMGLKVTVSGRITLDTFTSSKDGQTKTTLKLSVNEVDMHLPPREQGSAAHSAGSANRSAAAQDDDETIPF